MAKTGTGSGKDSTGEVIPEAVGELCLEFDFERLENRPILCWYHWYQVINE
jgi:hypothetical protein